jgi:iron complex transport system substrate-binding protein
VSWKSTSAWTSDMPIRHGWLTRPLAFLMCLGCGVAAAIVLIEALRPYGGTVQPQRSEVTAPLAERVNTPFPRVIRDASGMSLVIPHKPQRIISQTLGTDEILLAICAPQRIAALSILVDDADYSNVTAQAHLVKARANADAEQMLALSPDVIFVASYSKAELIELLQAARAPVFRFTHFDRLEDIKANIRTIGYAIGEDANADALVQHMEHHLAQIQASLPKDRQPIRVLSYVQGGSTAGAHTLFDDMLQALGVINITAEQGITGFRQISSEQLIRWNPDVIITSADRDAMSEARLQLLHDPAVAVTHAGKHKRVIVIPNHLFLTVTHHITQGIAQLARELYDEP